MERIKCGKCGATVFKTEVCSCGAVLEGASEGSVTERIKEAQFHLPKEMNDVVYNWFVVWYEKNKESIPEEDYAAALRFGFVSGGDIDDKF